MKRQLPVAAAALAALLVTTVFSSAQDTLTTLGEMRITGWQGDWPMIPQTGPKAVQVKKNRT